MLLLSFSLSRNGTYFPDTPRRSQLFKAGCVTAQLLVMVEQLKAIFNLCGFPMNSLLLILLQKYKSASIVFKTPRVKTEFLPLEPQVK